MHTYKLDRAGKVEVLQPGLEKAPVIIISGALANVAELVAYADEKGLATFAKGRALYPGVCLSTPEAYRQFIFREVMPIIADVYQQPQQALNTLNSDFSIVNESPDGLQKQQRLPHCDGPNPRDIAMIHYLCDKSFGGTSLYRHRATGYEYVTAARQKAYYGKLNQETGDDYQTEYAGYIDGSSTLFERYFSCSAALDKLFIYPCPVLHSGNIPARYIEAISSDGDSNEVAMAKPSQRRLTITNFLFNGRAS